MTGTICVHLTATTNVESDHFSSFSTLDVVMDGVKLSLFFHSEDETDIDNFIRQLEKIKNNLYEEEETE